MSIYEFLSSKENWNPNRVSRGNSGIQSKEKRNWLAQDLFVSLAWKTFYSFIIRATTIDTETMQTGHFLLR